MGTTGQPVQWGLQRNGKRVFWGKKGEKELAEEGEALGHGEGGGDWSRRGVQSCTIRFRKGKAENSEDALALRQVEKYT